MITVMVVALLQWSRFLSKITHFWLFCLQPKLKFLLENRKLATTLKTYGNTLKNKRFLALKWIGVCKIYSKGNNKLYIENAKRQVLSVAQQ